MDGANTMQIPGRCSPRVSFGNAPLSICLQMLPPQLHYFLPSHRKKLATQATPLVL